MRLGEFWFRFYYKTNPDPLHKLLTQQQESLPNTEPTHFAIYIYTTETVSEPQQIRFNTDCYLSFLAGFVISD